MTLKKLLTQIAAATALAAAAAGAQADTYQFTLSGDYSASWQLQSNPLPDVAVDGVGFILADVSGNFPGASGAVADLVFYSSDQDGGVEIDSGSTMLLATSGAQLYTGTEDAPTFTLGTFSLSQYGGTGSYTLTVTNISAVPEPASIALLLGGLGLVGAAAARRRRSENEQALDNV